MPLCLKQLGKRILSNGELSFPWNLLLRVREKIARKRERLTRKVSSLGGLLLSLPSFSRHELGSAKREEWKVHPSPFSSLSRSPKETCLNERERGDGSRE